MRRASAIPKPDRETVLDAGKLSNAEARFLVSNYYAAQEARKREDMQLRHLGDNQEQIRTKLLEWTAMANAEIESTVKRGLLKFCEASPDGQATIQTRSREREHCFYQAIKTTHP